MGSKSSEIPDRFIEFINQQKVFFVGTAGTDGRVNVSPKGMDLLKVINQNRVVWLNVTGSGNETSAHVQENHRMTLMFMAFEGNPLILRLYGNATVIHPSDPQWNELRSLFGEAPGARQLFDLSIDLVQASCGMSVPYYDYLGEREQLNDWAKRLGETGIEQYWERKNQLSLDGKPTNIIK